MITIKSWGFKYGRPEANIYFDVSYFKNPWRDEKIKDPNLSKEERKKLIFEFMLKQQGVNEFVNKMADLLKCYYSLFPNENLQISFCCSAGEFRSPVIAELVYERIKNYTKVELEQSKNSKI